MECNCAEKVLEGHRLIHYLCPLHKAAPDLYEALKGLLKDYSTNPLDDDFYVACVKARQALASAEGK